MVPLRVETAPRYWPALPPNLMGERSGRPMRLRLPPAAKSTSSPPRYRLYGPVPPKWDTDVRTRAGLTRSRVS